MANEIETIEFSSREQMFESCANDLFSFISNKTNNSSTCRVLLSGGSTPEPVYRLLATKIKNQTNIHWGLVDERFVDVHSEFSNEKMIRNALGNQVLLTGMVLDAENYEDNLKTVNEKYADFIQQTDIILLGMGEDGHFASLFPGDFVSEKLLAQNQLGIFNTTAPNMPHNRITCSMQLILNSSMILLMITGKKKKEVLENLHLNLPIHKLLSKRNDIHIYYAD
jgi:6-phosphogluconolactonase